MIIISNEVHRRWMWQIGLTWKKEDIFTDGMQSFYMTSAKQVIQRLMKQMRWIKCDSRRNLYWQKVIGVLQVSSHLLLSSNSLGTLKCADVTRGNTNMTEMQVIVQELDWSIWNMIIFYTFPVQGHSWENLFCWENWKRNQGELITRKWAWRELII